MNLDYALCEHTLRRDFSLLECAASKQSRATNNIPAFMEKSWIAWNTNSRKACFS